VDLVKSPSTGYAGPECDGPNIVTTATPSSGLEEYQQGICVQAAALLVTLPVAPAVLLLRRLDAIMARRSDRQRWNRRAEFLWAVYAQQTADLAGVLEHCAAAGRDLGARSAHTTNPHPGLRSESSVTGTIDAVGR
jgi:hypothetical protein